MGDKVAHNFAGLALHLWTIDTTPLEAALKAAKAAGFDAVELRRVDFKRCHERGLSNEAVLTLIRDSGLKVSAVGAEYGWTFAAKDDRERLFASLEETCENAVALGCATVMSGIGPGTAPFDEGVANVRRAGEIVARHGLRLALEYQFQHPIVRNLDILRDLIARAAQPSVGLLLDAYHLQRGGRPGRGFEEVSGPEIFYVQFSDVPDGPPNGVPPTDRLPPGKGIVRWSDLFQSLAAKGYGGFLSYEAPNPAHWARDAADVAREGEEATRRALMQTFGRASQA
ncbi:sugar phosphate isomerase/epimerase [Reyranella sp.]|uniref:sugar phosphate isomerase/epimerase family protein n=1 Tax=Reyranella sp. TaxID=1929291 RepID=UPI0012200A37|nr:sugar phosphate isomerase/epimerase family protein [Reyranella sp.]TAJ88311.1 MAG: sugar phosphate isomerase/epimerase [Reyranella sp.]